MAIFLAHTVLLAWASFGSAQRVFRTVAERVLAAFLLFWSNIVVTSLLLSSVSKLGEVQWFFRTSLVLGFAIWFLLRKSHPDTGPESPSIRNDQPNLLLLVGFWITLAPLVYASIRIASTYIPNNYDSLAYHLPRVMFYLGQNNLGHFDTGNPRQIFFPFDYNLLQLFGLIYGPPLQCLTFFNLASWLVSGLAVYRICRLCGYGADASLVACWLAMTATQILAQATATTNDLPVGAALLCAINFGLLWNQSRLRRHALLAGLAIGLASGSKLTLVYFGPAAVILILVIAWQFWRRNEFRSFVQRIRAWVFPALLAGALGAPFALINLQEKGLWMTKAYDFILNKPFSLVGAWQTTQAYLVQLFLDPLQRFTFDLDFTARLNDWGARTLFENWNAAYAISPLFLFPPDLNEDHVWFGLAGPLFLICAAYCLIRYRKLDQPVAWLALLGIGWCAAFFCLNKWSLYNQRYFVPVILAISPCLAATLESCYRHRRVSRYFQYVLFTVAVSAFWLAGVYLFKNTSRPYAPLWANLAPPPSLPAIPPVMAERLATQARVNIDSDDGNERIFLLMTMGKHQRFTAHDKIDDNAYNVLSRWGFPRGMAYTNIEQLASYVLIPFPSKPTAGVEFLGTMGSEVGAIDYHGLTPHANDSPSVEANRNIFVTLSYGPREPNRYIKTRIRVAGLNPGDHALLEVGLEDEDAAITQLASFDQNGETTVSINKPFRRFTFTIVDKINGTQVGDAEIPHIFLKPDPEKTKPSSADSLFIADLIRPTLSGPISSDGLGLLEGPYPQWDLPLFRWAKSPIVRIQIPADKDLHRLAINFSARLHARESADMDVLLNGKLLKSIHLAGRKSWFDESLLLKAFPGENVLEFRDVIITDQPDWLTYLDLYPDVKDWLVSQGAPLEEGAKGHYELHGRSEGRTVPRLHLTSPGNPDSLFYVFRNLRIEGFKSP